MYVYVVSFVFISRKLANVYFCRFDIALIICDLYDVWYNNSFLFWVFFIVLLIRCLLLLFWSFVLERIFGNWFWNEIFELYNFWNRVWVYYLCWVQRSCWLVCISYCNFFCTWYPMNFISNCFVLRCGCNILLLKDFDVVCHLCIGVVLKQVMSCFFFKFTMPS